MALTPALGLYLLVYAKAQYWFPFLFLLYIIDITHPIQSTMRLFADGSIAYREIKKNTCDHALLQ